MTSLDTGIARLRSAAGRVSDGKRHRGTQRNVPGEGHASVGQRQREAGGARNRRPQPLLLPEIKVENEAAEKAHHGAAFIGALGEDAQPKHAQQRPVGHRGNGQSDLDHDLDVARKHRQCK